VAAELHSIYPGFRVNRYRRVLTNADARRTVIDGTPPPYTDAHPNALLGATGAHPVLVRRQEERASS
jgi:hypothetical protein